MTSLIYREERAISPKDFQKEVRGWLDIKHLICDAVIHTHVEDTKLSIIMRNLVQDMSEYHPSEGFNVDLIENKIFIEREEQRLRTLIQGYDKEEFEDIVPTWLTTFCQVEGLKQRHVGLAFLKEPTNFGFNLEEVSVIVLVLSPSTDKETKSGYETCRTFATLMRDNHSRLHWLSMNDVIKIKESILEKSKELYEKEKTEEFKNVDQIKTSSKSCKYIPGRGIYNDFQRRLNNYKSDFTDGFKDMKSVSKVISTAVFLVFTILPTSIAYGMLNDDNTDGLINVQKVILGQWIGGLLFGLFGGQALLIVTTTAPLSIYVSVIHKIAVENNYNFYTFYCCVGIWAQILLILYAIFQVADLRKFVKRSTEETFGLFIACALVYKAISAVVTNYTTSYSGCGNETVVLNNMENCNPSATLLFIFLVFTTLWLSLTFSSLRRSSYLQKHLRELISDYALPLAVCIMAIVAYFVFYNVEKTTFPYYIPAQDINFVVFTRFPKEGFLTAFLLSIPLSFLFLIDQVLVTNTIDNKHHNLKKGSAYHWDLLFVGILNIVLSVLGLPWMHGALPSAFLHLKALSDVEDRFHNGYIQEVIVNVRETRVAVLIAHVLMIPIYFWLVPYIAQFFPTSLFNGLFLFIAISSLTGNEFWERLLLIITEQRSYPPTHYIRMIPQKTIHLFTFIELIELIILFVIGFYPLAYVELVFPIVIVLFVPIRSLILPLFFRKDHLEAIDGKH